MLVKEASLLIKVRDSSFGGMTQGFSQDTGTGWCEAFKEVRHSSSSE
jgi:hypothetical protein